MRTFVKFAGLTRPEAVAQVPDGGAAAFVAGVGGSPRSLAPAAIAALVERLPTGVEAWAQVEDPSVELVRQLFEEVGVDRIEVHGRIPDGLEFLELHHLVPSLPFPLDGTDGPLPKVPPAEDFPRLHLDAVGHPLAAGHAQQPNWELCRQVVDGQPGRKLVLSGGLTAANVGAAIGLVRPWGVGVGAGIEASPGVTDLAKMQGFLDALAEAEGAGAGPP